MSLIIGIRCRDGIVIGADSAATFGSMGRSTITQSAKKIKRPANGVICAIAGTAGLSQQFSGCIAELWQDDDFRAHSRHNVMSIISRSFFTYTKPLLEAAKAAKDLYGRTAWESAAGQAIVALPLADGPALFWFDETCAPEEVSEDLPFVSIGSGQMIADPFLALIKRVVWNNTAPPLDVGIFSVVWTLQHAIQTSAGGVAGPMQIITLTAEDGAPVIDEIDEDQLSTYKNHVKSAEDHVASIRDIFKPEAGGDPGTSAIPSPPDDAPPLDSQ